MRKTGSAGGPRAGLALALLVSIALSTVSASATAMPSRGAIGPSHRWVNLTGGLATAPSPRGGAGFAWDTAAGYGVLFGGLAGPSVGGYMENDTWTWNGSWTNITASAGAAPSPRENHAMMVDDPAVAGVLLFGGDRNGFGFNDTWLFHLGHWTNLTPTLRVSPPNRSIASMAYDPALHGVLLFGGTPTVGLYGFLNDTWIFRGAHWTELYPTHSPSARRGAQMAYDPAIGAMVLSGGLHNDRSGAARGISDTWRFNGTSWTKRGGASPPPQWIASFLYDPVLKALLLDGGCTKVGCSNASGTTFVYTGTGWTKASLLYHFHTAPVGRTGASATFDPRSFSVVYFGGIVFPSSFTSMGTNETWVFR